MVKVGFPLITFLSGTVYLVSLALLVLELLRHASAVSESIGRFHQLFTCTCTWLEFEVRR